MSLAETKASLSKATRELTARWIDVKSVWSDTQAEAFEQRFLYTIEQDVRSALAAMDQMNIIMQKIQRDCE